MNEAAEIYTESEEEMSIPGPVFKFVEFKLYRYRQNLAVINALPDNRRDILLRGRQWEPGGASGTPQGNPVERKTAQILLLEDKAAREAVFIQAIDDVMFTLSTEDQRLVQLKYFEGYLTNTGVARELHMSKATYYRRRELIIHKMAIRFGLL